MSFTIPAELKLEQKPIAQASFGLSIFRPSLMIGHSESASKINYTQSGMKGHNMYNPNVKGLICT